MQMQGVGEGMWVGRLMMCEGCTLVVSVRSTSAFAYLVGAVVELIIVFVVDHAVLHEVVDGAQARGQAARIHDQHQRQTQHTHVQKHLRADQHSSKTLSTISGG